jgi:hypothetical protein
MTRIALSIAFVTVWSPAALAWNGPSMWYEPADGSPPPWSNMRAHAGGEGVMGTGGAGDHFIQCSHCHVKPKGRINLSVTTIPGFASNTYRPGQRYQVTVKLLGETLGTPGKNINQFAATFEDANGKVTGVLESDTGQSQAPGKCPSGPPKVTSGTTVLYADCRVVISAFGSAENEPGADLTQWNFAWTAPASGSGPVNIYVGVGDGDGGATAGLSSLDDDVKNTIVRLGEGIAYLPSDVRPRPPWPGPIGLAIALVLPAGAFLRRRRRGG